MILNTDKKIKDHMVKEINACAISISKTISSLGPRAVPTNIVGDNLVKVQRLGSEIGINNLPTSARQLKHKVIKICDKCHKVELTSKYNFKQSFSSLGVVLCRRCAQNTEAESKRRSENQIRLHQDPLYKENACKGYIAAAKKQTKDKIVRYCKKVGIDVVDFSGFPQEERPYPLEFNRSLKQQVKIRDEFSCRICKNSQKALDIHHIDFDRSNNSMSNLTSLCRQCHSRITKGGPECLLNLELMI